VPQDYAKARQWYEKAAARGYAMAQYKLGQLYHFALGVPQNYAEATKWYEKAAAQGDADAQFSLGLMSAIGDGVPQDDVRAYMWWSLAVAHSTGNKQKATATQRDGALTRRMTPAQVAEAQRLSQQCQAQQFKGC
jgi:TPR repeat protein